MKTLLIFLLLLISQTIHCQNNVEQTYSTLEYHPEVPDTNSYVITINEPYEEISTAILGQINFHRKRDEDFLWVVKEGLEILIFSINHLRR
jgi:hypothetical protein